MPSPHSPGSGGAYVDWADSKGLNEWESKALELSEERSRIAYSDSSVFPNEETTEARVSTNRYSDE